ncbi:HAD hydrolase-like protein [Candidatus Gracilibacteria bacterium]|nr:HAD hydrolase-like protein [Candidatus Gracilibacteria bacterium]MCF7898373.1 HAD hydrolase-like protein [Candidatus Paceibacterota bacterium]
MIKKRIGIDFDDVLFSCNERLQPFHNSRYGTNLVKDNIATYYLHDLWKCTKEEAYKRILEFYNSEEHHSMEPMTGVVKAIHKLSKNYELFIITARPPEAEEVTKKLLQHFYTNEIKSWDKIFSKIHFVGTVGGKNKTITKAEVCLHEGIDIFIEDNVHNAVSVALAGIPSLLLNQPWNENETIPDTVKRVYSWEEIVNEVNKTLS